MVENTDYVIEFSSFCERLNDLFYSVTQFEDGVVPNISWEAILSALDNLQDFPIYNKSKDTNRLYVNYVKLEFSLHNVYPWYIKSQFIRTVDVEDIGDNDAFYYRMGKSIIGDIPDEIGDDVYMQVGSILAIYQIVFKIYMTALDIFSREKECHVIPFNLNELAANFMTRFQDEVLSKTLQNLCPGIDTIKPVPIFRFKTLTDRYKVINYSDIILHVDSI